MKFLFIITVFLTVHSQIFAQENPFFLEVEDSTELQYRPIVVTDTMANISENHESLLSSFIQTNAKFQQKLKTQMSLHTRNFREGSGRALWFIFLFAFLYGVMHSLGPGHGKVAILSYVLTQEPQLRKSITLAGLIATFHAGMGAAVALVLIWFFREFSTYLFSNSSANEILSYVAYCLMIAVGIYLFFHALRSHSHLEQHKSNVRMVPFALSIGLIPCPVSMLTVTYLGAQGLLWVGIFSVLFIIVGMWLTLCLFAFLGLYTKKGALSVGSSKKKETLHKFFALSGSVGVILFGVFLVFSHSTML